MEVKLHFCEQSNYGYLLNFFGILQNFYISHLRSIFTDIRSQLRFHYISVQNSKRVIRLNRQSRRKQLNLPSCGFSFLECIFFPFFFHRVYKQSLFEWTKLLIQSIRYRLLSCSKLNHLLANPEQQPISRVNQRQV